MHAGHNDTFTQAFGQALSAVVSGIREGRFYIVPAQPDVKGNIAIRAQDLLELRNRTLRRG